jgi:predicted DNA-binding transcriptional regulator AlpA
MKDSERLMTLSEVSELLGVSLSTLYGWRYRGGGPSGYRIGRPGRAGRTVRYQVRYRDPAGRSYAETHRRQIDGRAAEG